MSNLKRWNRRLAKGMAVLLALALFMSGSGMTVLAQEVGEAVSEVVEESTEEEEVVETTEESEEASEEVSEETSSEVSEEVSDAEESEEASEEIPEPEMALEDVADTTATIEYSGDWGESVHWTLDSDGVLTITQDEGVEYEYFDADVEVPWETWEIRQKGIKKFVWGANCFTKNYRYDIVRNAFSIPHVQELEILDCVNTSYITNMDGLFFGLNVKKLDLTNLNTENVTSMREMFYGCSQLEEIVFGDFDTSNVTDMYGMFMECDKLVSLDLTPLETSKVYNMVGMFYYCSSLKQIDLSSFDTGKVESMNNMFAECQSLESLDLSSFDTSKVSNMSYMFAGCTSLKNVNLASFNTTRVTNYEFMFNCCISLKELDLSSFEMSWSKCDLSAMFAICSELESLNIENMKFYVGEEIEVDYMFSSCPKLKYVDLSGFDGAVITTMYGMFYGCSSLDGIDVSKLNNTKSVKDMSDVFYECSSLTRIDLSGFNTSNVSDMSAMFYGCSSLEELDLSNFNTLYVTDYESMFGGCSNIEYLDLSSFNMGYAKYVNYMFNGMSKLVKMEAPLNLKKNISLTGRWKRLDTDETITYIPTLSESVTLERIYVKPEKISLNKTELKLEKEQTAYLYASVQPYDANDLSVEWTTSNEEVAAVDQNGVITARALGTATITAKARAAEGVVATCKVSVVQMATEVELKLDKGTNENGEYMLSVDVAAIPSLEWKNGEAWPTYYFSYSGAELSIQDGKIIPKKAGTGVLTVYSQNNGIAGPNASVNYCVAEKSEPISGITLNQTKVTLDAQSERNSFLLEAFIDNADVAFGKIDFSTNKPSMVSIEDHGNNTATVTLIDGTPGTATVTATATDGSGKSATCTIVSGTSVESITVSAPLETIANGGYLLGTGKSAKLTAGILPANATAKTVTWASSDAGVAKVDANGTVTAVNPGVAFITATATDGSGVNGTAVINVTRPASAMKLELVDNESGKVGIYYPEGGTAFEVKAVLTGTDGKTDNVAQDVNYTVSGKGAKNVVYLGDGRFAAKAPGVVTVTATAKDGSKVKASKQVTIEQLVYAFDVQAPKNTESYMYQNYEHWIAYIGTKDVTLTPVVTYNDGVKEYAPAKEYQKVEFMLPENGPLSVDKKGTGIVVSKNAEPGMYSVTIKHKNVCELKPVYIDVVKAENTYLKDAAIVLPKNMPALTDDSVLLVEGSKVKLSASVNGVENLKGYTVTWSVAGNENNTGSAAISAAGLLDLSGAKASEEYLVTLTVSKGEASVTKMLSVAVTKKTDVSAMKLVLAENQSEALPASFNVQYGNNGKVFKVADQNGAANLYSVTGGKKGVLTIEETEGGYIVLAEGTGSVKLTITALDGSNAKKAITVKVVPAGNPVNKLTMGSKSYSVEPNMPIAIPYSIATKNGKDASDTRVEWTSSNAGILQVSADNADSASESCITTAAKGYLTLVAKTGMTGKVTLTGRALDGSKKTVKVTVNVVNSGKKEVTYKLSLQTPAKTPNGGVAGLALVTYGKSVKLTANVLPNKAKNKTISYTIVGVDANGQQTLSEAELKAKGVTVKKGVVAASKKSSYTGYVKVTATLDYMTYVMGEATPITAEKKLYVQPGVTKVEITGADGKVMKTATVEAGTNLVLNAKVTGAGTLTYSNVSWSVSDSKIASVDANGFVTIKADAKKGKKVKVTATALDGSKKKAVVTITVK